MSPKMPSNENNQPKPGHGAEVPAKQAEPVLTAASVSMDAPVALEAQEPSQDLLSEFSSSPRGEQRLRDVRLAAANAMGCEDITEHLSSKEKDALGMLKDRLEEHEGSTLRQLKARERALEKELEEDSDVYVAEDLDSVRMAIAVKGVCRLRTAIDLLDAELERMEGE